MDLSPLRIDRDAEIAPLSAEMAVLLASVGARQAASVTAQAQAALSTRDADEPLFAPLDGAFNGGMAREMEKWKDGPERPVKVAFTEPF